MNQYGFAKTAEIFTANVIIIISFIFALLIFARSGIVQMSQS